MQKINVFVKKNDYFNLTDSSKGNYGMFNPPMYNLQIKLYKGIENKVQFSVRDNDRKAYRLRDKELYFTMINHNNHSKTVKKLWQVDAYKGIYELVMTEKEMRDFEPSTYQASIVYKDLEGEETMLYSSINYDPVFNVIIEEGFREVFKPSFELNPAEFLHQYYTSKEDGKRYDEYVSSIIKADESDTHNASIRVQGGFLGTITMQGSCEVNPQSISQTDWVDIASKEYTLDNKVDDETFEFKDVCHNLLWVRFKYSVKSANCCGKVSEIVYRN